MPQEKPSLLIRFRELVSKIKQAKDEINPFKAKALKNEIEPQIEPMALEAVELIHSLEQRCIYLQKQIGLLDARLSDLGG